MSGTSDCHAESLKYETEKGILTYNENGSIESYEGSDETLVIPDEINGCKITTIRNGIFKNSSTLTDVTLPKTLSHIDSRAFTGCSALVSIHVSAENNSYASQDGILYNKEKTKVILCPPGTEGGILLSEKVTEISNGAFSDCSALTGINVAAENSSYSSQDGVVYNKDKTEVILCPPGVEEIHLAEGVTDIRYRAFEMCLKLSDIELPQGLERIGEHAFEHCQSLKTITFPDSLKTIGRCAFYGCGLTSVRIPESVTELGEFAFEQCSYLFDVELPENLEPGKAFWGSGWHKMQNFSCGEHVTCRVERGTLTVSGTGEMYDSYRFNWPIGVSDYVSSIVIEKDVTGIGNNTFSHFTNLSSVTFHDGLIKIGQEAFTYCPNLKEASIPLSVTEIGAYAFGQYGVYYSGPDGKGTDFFTYEDGFIIHGYTNSEAERYARETERITFDSIGVDPDGPYQPNNPDQPNNPNNPNQPGNSDKTENPGNQEPTNQPGNPDPTNQPNDAKVPVKGAKLSDGANTWKVTAAGKTVAFVKTKSKSRSISIPATVKIGTITYRVTSVADNAFKGNTTVKQVTIGKNVTAIGKSAFENCTELSSVSIGKNVTSIGKKAFFNDKKLKKVVIQTKKLTAKKIGQNAFRNIHAKAKIKTPASKVASYQSILRKKGIGKTAKVMK